MKKCIKIISLVFIISSLVFSSHYSSFAASKNTTKKANDKTIDTDITGNTFIEDLKPDNLKGTPEKLSTPFVNLIQNVVNPVLGVVQVIGGILTVVSIALFGLGMLLSGNEHLAGDLGLKMMGGPRWTWWTRCKSRIIKLWKSNVNWSSIIILWCNNSKICILYI